MKPKEHIIADLKKRFAEKITLQLLQELYAKQALEAILSTASDTELSVAAQLLKPIIKNCYKENLSHPKPLEWLVSIHLAREKVKRNHLSIEDAQIVEDVSHKYLSQMDPPNY